MFLKRLDRYMLREMGAPFLVGQAAVAVMLTGTVLYNNADTFINYSIPAMGIAKIAFYFLPYLISLTMPVAVAIGSSLMVSRMARDSEITVMRAAGISLRRIFLPVIFLGLVFSGFDFWFGEKVVPAANVAFEKTLSALSRNIQFLVPTANQFVQSPDKKYGVMVGSIQPHKDGTATLSNVLVTIYGPAGSLPSIVMANTADYADGVWTLHDAKSHVYTNGGRDEQYMEVKTWKMNLRLAERAFNSIMLQLPLYSSAATRTFSELNAQVQQQRKFGYKNDRDLLEWHFKLSVPFSCLVFAIVCPPLALRFARAGSFMGVLLSIAVVFVYWNTLLAAKIIGGHNPNLLPPAVAGWGQNIIFSIIGLVMLRREE
jgi:LPS export ABC transporter permease LptG